MTVLLNNVDVDTTSAEFKPSGGIAMAIIRGDSFGGGTVNIEIASTADNRFATFPNASFTANGTIKLDYLPVGTIIRADFTGSTGASNVFVEILQ